MIYLSSLTYASRRSFFFPFSSCFFGPNKVDSAWSTADRAPRKALQPRSAIARICPTAAVASPLQVRSLPHYNAAFVVVRFLCHAGLGQSHFGNSPSYSSALIGSTPCLNHQDHGMVATMNRHRQVIHLNMHSISHHQHVIPVQ
jgi:hypothetical protein